MSVIFNLAMDVIPQEFEGDKVEEGPPGLSILEGVPRKTELP